MIRLYYAKIVLAKRANAALGLWDENVKLLCLITGVEEVSGMLRAALSPIMGVPAHQQGV